MLIFSKFKPAVNLWKLNFTTMRKNSKNVEKELLAKLNTVAAKGFIPSTTNADSGVGDTLENLLGLQRNANKTPDYKGIELKTSRLDSRTGVQKNRSTLFAQAPNWGKSVLKNGRDFIDMFGYVVDDSTGLKALHVTLSNTPNVQGLFIRFDVRTRMVDCVHVVAGVETIVACWDLSILESRLLEKHKSTFWVKAETKTVDSVEHFQYAWVEVTSKPNVNILGELINAGHIQLDYTFSEKVRASGKVWVRDHGHLWKIKPASMGLLFPPSKIHILGKA